MCKNCGSQTGCNCARLGSTPLQGNILRKINDKATEASLGNFFMAVNRQGTDHGTNVDYIMYIYYTGVTASNGVQDQFYSAKGIAELSNIKFDEITHIGAIVVYKAASDCVCVGLNPSTRYFIKATSMKVWKQNTPSASTKHKKSEVAKYLCSGGSAPPSVTVTQHGGTI